MRDDRRMFVELLFYKFYTVIELLKFEISIKIDSFKCYEKRVHSKRFIYRYITHLRHLHADNGASCR